MILRAVGLFLCFGSFFPKKKNPPGGFGGELPVAKAVGGVVDGVTVE